MDTNEPKKWRTDYSLLLKCWSMLKTSELLIQTARNELKSFTAEEKAINRLKTFTEKNDSLTVFDQTINLWKQSIDQFINQNNFLAAAECLENLSEIQFKYGSNELKKESLNTLLRASKYYKKASETKRAIILIKRYLTISEFSTERDIDLISTKYKECEVLYEALDLHDMSELNRKIGDFFKEISPYIENSLKIKQRKSSIEFKSHFNELTTASNGEHSMPSTSRRQQLGMISVSDNTINSDENELQNKEIDDKESLKELIKQMNEKNNTKSESSEHNSESDDDNTEDMEEPISKCRSNQLLRQNLMKLKINNKFDVSDQTSNEKTVKRIKISSISDKKVMTTEITAVPSKTKYKRNRKPKPKESSEELPEKRILKLNRKDFVHYFVVDYKNPSKRLYCTLCKDSVLSYRWSTITDHLETKKHKNIELMQEVFQLTGETLIHNNSNNNNILTQNSSHLSYIYNNTNLSEIDYNFYCKTTQSQPFIQLLTIDSTPTEGTQNNCDFLPLNSTQYPIQSNTPLMLQINDPIDDNNQNRTLNTPEINLENDILKNL